MDNEDREAKVLLFLFIYNILTIGISTLLGLEGLLVALILVLPSDLFYFFASRKKDDDDD